MDNMFHGNGTLNDGDGGHYEGRFERGKKEGYGIQHFFDGGFYKGNWHNNLKHGFGTLIEWKSDDSKKDTKKEDKKEGYWKNDQYIGVENPAN